MLFDEVGAREFLVAALKPVNRDGTTLKLFAVSSDLVSEITLGEWRLPFFSVLRVALNEKGNITILLSDSDDPDYPKDMWRVEDHDIATGTLISSKSIRISPTTIEVLRDVTASGVREPGVIQRPNAVE